MKRHILLFALLLKVLYTPAQYTSIDLKPGDRLLNERFINTNYVLQKGEIEMFVSSKIFSEILISVEEVFIDSIRFSLKIEKLQDTVRSEGYQAIYNTDSVSPTTALQKELKQLHEKIFVFTLSRTGNLRHNNLVFSDSNLILIGLNVNQFLFECIQPLQIGFAFNSRPTEKSSFTIIDSFESKTSTTIFRLARGEANAATLNFDQQITDTDVNTNVVGVCDLHLQSGLIANVSAKSISVGYVYLRESINAIDIRSAQFSTLKRR